MQEYITQVQQEMQSGIKHSTCKSQKKRKKKHSLNWLMPFLSDLMSLDGEELLIQVFCKRNVKKDKFLGQSQLRVSV